MIGHCEALGTLSALGTLAAAAAADPTWRLGDGDGDLDGVAAVLLAPLNCGLIWSFLASK